MSSEKTFLNWSSGKDATMALHRLMVEETISVDKLITTVNASKQRVSMHGVQHKLLGRQAESLGIPLERIELNDNIGLSDYNEVMASTLTRLKGEGFTQGAFGDILLEDLMSYRKEQYASKGLKALFPIWKENTFKLIDEFIDLGYKAVVVCINSRLLDDSFCGREIDRQFIEDLPADVDPCGENGEFHTFVYDGPLFSRPVAFSKGQQVVKYYKSAPGKSDGDDCFAQTKPWDTAFRFQELIP